MIFNTEKEMVSECTAKFRTMSQMVPSMQEHRVFKRWAQTLNVVNVRGNPWRKSIFTGDGTISFDNSAVINHVQQIELFYGGQGRRSFVIKMLNAPFPEGIATTKHYTVLEVLENWDKILGPYLSLPQLQGVHHIHMGGCTTCQHQIKYMLNVALSSESYRTMNRAWAKKILTIAASSQKCHNLGRKLGLSQNPAMKTQASGVDVHINRLRQTVRLVEMKQILLKQFGRASDGRTYFDKWTEEHYRFGHFFQPGSN